MAIIFLLGALMAHYSQYQLVKEIKEKSAKLESVDKEAFELIFASIVAIVFWILIFVV